MGEIVILPEMLAAGMEALDESRERKFIDGDTVVEIYMAMEGARVIALFMRGQESIH